LFLTLNAENSAEILDSPIFLKSGGEELIDYAGDIK
jgi:hypothetical protein